MKINTLLNRSYHFLRWQATAFHFLKPSTTTALTRNPRKARMGKQGHGRRLTDKERMEIIELTRQDPRIKHVELAARYNVNESTIRKWRLSANAEKIETRYGLGVEDVRDARQRGQVVRNAQFDAALYEWVSTMRTANAELPPSKIRERAKTLSAQFDGMQDFKASSGWYYRFCRRYGLPCPPARGVKRSDVPVASAMLCAPQAPNGADEVTAPTESAVDEADQRVKVDVQDVASPHEPVRREKACEPAPEGEQDAQTRNVDSPEREHVAQTSALNSSSSEREQGTQKTTAPKSFATTASPPKASHESSAPGLISRKRKHEDAVSAQVETDERVARLVRQRTLESPPRNVQPAEAPATPAAAASPSPSAALATPVVAAASPSVMTSPVLSVRQEVISHFLRHHKDLLSLASRLRFIKHLAHASEEAEMYAVMDDETRIEYIKEFADKGNDGASAGVVGESVV